MRKRFLHDRYGAEEAFWTQRWERDWDQGFVGAPPVDRTLVEQIEKYLAPGGRLLEGGCGDCSYVRYFHDRGYDVIGVDYSDKTVDAVKRRLPALKLSVGNILDFDFPDNSFDGYYSGGVIEHFEEGVDPQIREAHRVLKRGGHFFVTVPHMNWVRRFTASIKTEYRKLDLDGRLTIHRENLTDFGIAVPPPDFHFYEHVFTTQEMRGFLTRNGFEIEAEVAFSPYWGLMDVGFYRKLCGVGLPRRNLFHKIMFIPMRALGCFGAPAWLGGNALSRAMGVVTGNMKLYVCKAVKPA